MGSFTDFYETSGLVLVFTNYQRIVIFQISSDQNSAPQIAKSDSSYIRLHGNNCDIPLFLQIDNSLNSLTQSIQSMQTVFKCDNTILYTNVMAAMENFVVSKEINYAYMALSQNKFVLPNLSITMDLFKPSIMFYVTYNHIAIICDSIMCNIILNPNPKSKK